MKYFISFSALLFTFSHFLLLSTDTQETTPPQQPISDNKISSTVQSPLENEVTTEVEPTFLSDTPVFDETNKDYSSYTDPQGHFELPLEGATGYAAISLNVRELPTSESPLIFTVSPGIGFTIREEDGNWWLVDINGTLAYVYHPYCFLNLPDVLPSAIYKNTNASHSVFTSSYQPIPNITGLQLYDSVSYNQRLGREEYIMPVLYGTAKKLAYAQQLAKSDGNTLILYETYRPYAVQELVREELIAFSKVDTQIKAGISTAPWSTNWFIATGISNHQRGYAVDASLGKIEETEEFLVGDYLCESITRYEEAEMPTPIHELSVLSKSMASPVNSNNDIDWRTAPLSNTMNEPAIQLRAYFTEAGLTPLASEWWHFNDLDYYGMNTSTGDFILTEVCSVPPTFIS